MTKNWCSEVSSGVRMTVHIAPNAKKSEVVGIHDGALKIKLQAQPIEGKANEALIRFVADRLGLPQRAVTIARGHTNKNKLLDVSAAGLSCEIVERAML